MNRKVKFRAIVPVNSGGDPKRLEYFDLSLDDDISRLLYADYDANELMQFTGLLDKNGKEIYEGDIIQNVADDGRRLSKFEITWQQSCCGFVKEREDGNTFTLEISRFFEVIGNIYEHKHLLQ